MRANIVANYKRDTLSKAKGHLNFSLMKLFELRKKKLFISKVPLPVAKYCFISYTFIDGGVMCGIWSSRTATEGKLARVN